MRIALACLTVFACTKRDDAKPESAPPTSVATPKAPIRSAVADNDLRVLIADLASSKACEMIRGQFRGLRAPDRPDLVTGVLWIQDCKITNDDTRVSFQISGHGWQWAEQTKKKAGGSFALRQYVKFGYAVTIPGAFDIAYDRPSHVVSLWFTPSKKPEVEFSPVGAIDVDRQGAWSTVIGGLSSAFSDSPEDLARKEAKKQGSQQFESTLADGLAVTIDLCTGLGRFNLGRKPKGAMQAPDVGETKRVPIELQPGGVMIAGPQIASKGMTIHAETTSGAAQIALVCQAQAEEVARLFVDGKEPTAGPILGFVDVRGTAKLTIKPASCPVVAVARALDRAPVTFSWLRMPSEIARSTGGPLISCK